MGRRRRARELAVQALFHLEFSPGDPEEVFTLLCENFAFSGTSRAFARGLVTGVCDQKRNLDERIGRSSTNWRLERMSRVDRNILRLGVFELLFMEDIPPKVSIDEAVELAKKYGTEDSASFINGILDHVYNQLRLPGEEDPGGVGDKIGKGSVGA
jgi:transcription antitermination factor NusB